MDELCIGYVSRCSIMYCHFYAVILCEDGKEYSDCGSPCPVTCDNFLQPIICPSVCSQGCFCPEGTVLHNNQCIPPIQCPSM